jgi:hypothetical protein
VRCRAERPAAAAAERLVSGVLRLLRQTNPYADPQPDISRYLLDGTFEAVLAATRGP